MKAICFTGHRPSKLGGYDWNTEKNQKIMIRLCDIVEEILSKCDAGDEVKFIGGGALGTDQMGIHVVNRLKEYFPQWSYIEVAVPFKDQPIKWFNSSDVKRYNEQLNYADKVTYVDKIDKYKIKGYEEDRYYPAKMQKRNEYMIDNSDIVIAVWDGSKGGTCNCVQYAKKLGKEIIYINPKEL